MIRTIDQPPGAVGAWFNARSSRDYSVAVEEIRLHGLIDSVQQLAVKFLPLWAKVDKYFVCDVNAF